MEHPDRLEKLTRETCHTGGWASKAVVTQGMRRGEHISFMVNRVFDVIDVLLTPPMAQRPPIIGVLDGAGTVRASMRSLQIIAYTALWNVAGNPAVTIPAGIGADGMPLSVQLVGPRDGEELLFGLGAQLERARPWPLVAPEPA